MTELKKYEYEDLSEPRLFRLVELHAGNEQDAIVCEIHIRRHEFGSVPAAQSGAASPIASEGGEDVGDHLLSQQSQPEGERNIDTIMSNESQSTRLHYIGPKYEALSYTWGGADNVIQVTTRGHRRKFTIQSNLESALRQLRYPSQSRFLWVDSICINQKNKNELNHQVSDMASIYSNAQKVLVWLGVEMEHSNMAFDHMQCMLNLEEIDNLTQTEDPIVLDRWAALFHLIRRRWFSRRWVVQEVALAKRVLLHCGSKSVTWDDFADAVQLFASSAKEINQLFKSSKKYKSTSSFLGDMSSLGVVRLVKMQVLRSFTTRRPPEKLLTLEELVSTLTVFESADPKDTIYAVVALAKDANPKPLNEETKKAKRSPLKRHMGSDSDASKAYPSQKRQQTGTISEVSQTVFSEPLAASPLAQSPLVASSDTGIAMSAPNTIALSSNLAMALPTPTIKLSTDSLSSYISFHDRPGELAGNVVRSWKIRVAKKRLEVSYAKSVFEVFRDFMELAFRSSDADHSPLDIICRPWAPVLRGKYAEEKLPSWMRDVSGFAFGARKYTTSGRIYQRQNADPLVGSPGTTRRLYTASKNMALMPTFGKDPKSKVLKVRGFVYDEVASCSFYSSGGNVPSDWIRFVDWAEVPENPPEEFWRTLVAERDVNGERVPALYKRAFKYLYTRAENQYTDLMPRMCLNGDPPKYVVDLVERLEAVIWGRCLMRTVGKRHLGLGPRDLKQRDLVCILLGCSVPVLLRESDEDGKKFYNFIGECYVHGIMDGEALDGDWAARDFMLR